MNMQIINYFWFFNNKILNQKNRSPIIISKGARFSKSFTKLILIADDEIFEIYFFEFICLLIGYSLRNFINRLKFFYSLKTLLPFCDHHH